MKKREEISRTNKFISTREQEQEFTDYFSCMLSPIRNLTRDNLMNWFCKQNWYIFWLNFWKYLQRAVHNICTEVWWYSKVRDRFQKYFFSLRQIFLYFGLPITVKLRRKCFVGDLLKSARHLYRPENHTLSSYCNPLRVRIFQFRERDTLEMYCTHLHQLGSGLRWPKLLAACPPGE